MFTNTIASLYVHRVKGRNIRAIFITISHRSLVARLVRFLHGVTTGATGPSRGGQFRAYLLCPVTVFSYNEQR